MIFSCCSWIWTYSPNSTLQWLWKSSYRPIIMAWGLIDLEILASPGNMWIQKISQQTSSTISLCGIIRSVRVLYMSRICYFIAQMQRLNYRTCSLCETTFMLILVQRGQLVLLQMVRPYIFLWRKSHVAYTPFKPTFGCDEGFGLHVTNMFPCDETDLFWDFHYKRYFIHLHDACW